MNRLALVFPLLAFAPLFGQNWEVGLFSGSQRYSSVQVVESLDVTQAAANRKSVLGIRAGYSLYSSGPNALQVTAGYQPRVSGPAHVTFSWLTLDLRSGSQTTYGDYGASHGSLGLMYTFRSLVGIGVGVEVRKDKLTFQGEDATYTRPWLRLDLGVELPALGARTFVGVEGAWAAETDPLGPLPRAMAPNAQLGVYLSVRF